MMSDGKETPPYPETDVEKEAAVRISHASPSPDGTRELHPTGNIFQRWNSRIENLAGFEARGLERVQPEDRQAPSAMGLLQMLLLWFSANISINNLAVAFCGPLIYKLGFVDSSLCAVFGILLGALSTAYMSTWGAVSGNRTMVSTLSDRRSQLTLLRTNIVPGCCSILHGLL